jgi:hypothetical protein
LSPGLSMGILVARPVARSMTAGRQRILLGCSKEREMENTVIVALISSGGAVLIGITALLLNYRGFVSLDVARFKN